MRSDSIADARLALREGTYRDGLQLIDRALALDPDAIDARIVRARLLIVNYHMYEAAAEARLVLLTDPQNYAGAHHPRVSGPVSIADGELAP